jgi:hypothetical protein
MIGFAVLAGALGCSQETTTTPEPVAGGPTQTSEVTISGPGGASVTVPPGASPTPVSIAIAQNPTDAPAIDPNLSKRSSVFAVTPHGAQFSKPVTVRIPLLSGLVDENLPLLVLRAEEGEDWMPVGSFLRNGDVIEVPVTGFSYFAVTQLQGLPAQPNASLTLEPIDPGYRGINGRYLVNPDVAEDELTIVRAKVTVTGHIDCRPGVSEVIRVYTSASVQLPGQGGPLAQVTAFSSSAASLGWSEKATQIEIPLFLNTSNATNLLGHVSNQASRAEFRMDAELICSDYSAIGRVKSTNGLSRQAWIRYPGRLGFSSGPQDATVAPGERPGFTVLVLGGTEVPTDFDQYTVEWQRSDDGGATWRGTDEAVAYQSEVPDHPHLGYYAKYYQGWAIRRATFSGPPAKPEDNGAVFQARVCRAVPAELEPFYSSNTDCAVSPAARLTVRTTSAPVFTTQPQSALVVAGSAATFAVAASGSPTPTLQWQSLAPGASAWVDIPGATASTLTTPTVGLSDNGTQFRAVAMSSAGSATSGVALVAVSPAPIAPTIQVQPFDVTAAPGSTASFVVVAHGSDPLSYQWRRDGNAIAGATGPRVDLPDVAIADSGAHLDVVVSNPAGSITSSPAILTVSTIGVTPVAPTITQQPVSGTTTAPYPALFTVVASGTPPLSYQWLLNGVAIPGANDASYGTGLTTIGQPPQTYSVVVWNAGGAVVSSGAILTVVAGAPLTVQSVTPAAGSTGNPSLTSTIDATFSEILDCTSIDATSFQVVEGTSPVAGTVDCTNPTLTFTPSQPLPTRTTLRAHLGSDIRDKFGITLGAPYEWTFGVAPWTRQLGTAAHDEPLAVKTDGAGNVLLTGYTAGGLEGNTLTGIVDAFAVKLAPSGARLWTRQIGAASAFTYGYGVGADTAGNVYVAGHTNGTLPGNTSSGTYDLFLTKLDPAGNVLWTQQHGTTLAVQVAGLAVDGDGNAFVVGWTQGSLDGQTNAGAEDVFVVKYDTTGARLWTRMFGSPATDYATSIALDATGHILVAGYTRGSIDGNGNAGIDDLFVLKLASDGTLLWARQLGSAAMDQAWGVATDLAQNVYAAGWTRGSLDGQTSHGGQDIVVVKWDTSGTKQWTQQLGTAADDWATGISVDANGDLYVVGGTQGPLDGGSNTGATQLYVAKLVSGVVRWVFQEGSQPFGYDLAETVTTDGSGNVFATGITNGGLDGNTSAGDYDAFVVKVQQDGTPR